MKHNKYIKPNHAILLYAKGWYLETNIFEDLSTLLSPCFAYEMSERDVFQVTANLVYDVLTEGEDFRKNQFVEIFTEIAPDHYRWDGNWASKLGDKDCHFYRTIVKFLGILSVSDLDVITKVLGERLSRPDYRYLRSSGGVTPEKLGKMFNKTV